jgi:hypothetical protein
MSNTCYLNKDFADSKWTTEQAEIPYLSELDNNINNL